MFWWCKSLFGGVKVCLVVFWWCKSMLNCAMMCVRVCLVVYHDVCKCMFG